MPLVIGGVAPHGFPIIPDISDDAEGALATRAAMETLGERFAAAGVEVVFIVGPHGVRVNGSVSLSDCGRGAGTLHWAGRTVEMNVPFDLPLKDDIAARARAAGVNVAEVGYGASSAASSVLPLDWGIMTPLWFCGHRTNQVGLGHVLGGYDGTPLPQNGPKAIVANPSRLMPRMDNVTFGRAVAEAAQADSRRVGIIASCDWAHSHAESGPYGFHPDAAPMDAQVVAALKDNDIMRLIDLDDTFVRNAAIDGLWQLLMLAGAQQVVPMDIDVLSYEAPTYYGMIVATCSPSGSGA